MTRRLFALACALVAAVPLLAGARAPHAARSTSAALSVTLVYDLSVGVSSVPLAKDEGFKRIVQWVVAELKPADQLRVGLLTEGRRLTRPFESHELGTLWPDVITKASVPDAERFGASPLWDNLDAVVRAIAQDPGRRAILILTDGRSTGNHISVHTLIADAACRSDHHVSRFDDDDARCRDALHTGNVARRESRESAGFVADNARRFGNAASGVCDNGARWNRCVQGAMGKSGRSGCGRHDRGDRATAWRRPVEGKPVEAKYHDGGGHDSFFEDRTQDQDEVTRMVTFLLRRLPI